MLITLCVTPARAASSACDNPARVRACRNNAPGLLPVDVVATTIPNNSGSYMAAATLTRSPAAHSVNPSGAPSHPGYAPAECRSHHEGHLDPPKQHSVDVEDITRQSPDARLPRNCRQMLLSGRGDGPNPAVHRIRRIVPSPSRSPRRPRRWPGEAIHGRNGPVSGRGSETGRSPPPIGGPCGTPVGRKTPAGRQRQGCSLPRQPTPAPAGVRFLQPHLLSLDVAGRARNVAAREVRVASPVAMTGLSPHSLVPAEAGRPTAATAGRAAQVEDVSPHVVLLGA